MPDWSFSFHIYPWLPLIGTAGIVALLSAILLFYASLEHAFAHRDIVLTLILIVSCGFTGINVGPLELTDGAFLFVLCIWLVCSFIEHRPIVSPVPVLAMILVLFFLFVASIINGGITTIAGLHSPTMKLLYCILVIEIASRPRAHPVALRAFMGIAIMSAIVGILSSVVYILTGFAFTMDDLPEYQFKNTPFGKMLRCTAFLPRTQPFGHLMIIATCLALFLPMTLKRRLLLVALFGLGIAFTFSTGAAMTLAAVFLVWIIIRSPRHLLHYVTLVGSAVLLAHFTGLLAWVYEELIVPIGGWGAGDRVEFNRVAVRIIREHPWIGMGFRNVIRVLTTPIHNTYLQMAADIGCIGGAVFTALVLYLAVSVSVLARRTVNPETRALLKAFSLAMIGICIHFCVEPFYDNMITWMFLGLVTATLVRYHPPGPVSAGAAIRWTPGDAPRRRSVGTRS